MTLVDVGLWCGTCHTDEHLTFLDDLVDTPECGCQHIVCATCGQDPEERE
jgi:hypothetical protein